ncbi:MerR family transcriptional regulator [Rubellimicrobium roseum]|uniref:MerR family transcriptional regulator n=1 Tax=Rubellimicrobium roseum TaxID=687525 RepID=A0A5C4NBL1_9RHOB|nr:MerR family transcriptional regulator [Rubellimicrobium roseum]TNC71422.1 MerR family transcriptional regulator [Rubellimicrobium roseum]
MAKSPDAFRTISEVAALLETPAHVLRFWESKFTQIKPVKGAGGRRYFRPDDIALLGGIKVLLYEQDMRISGVQKLLRERGPRYVAGLSALPWTPDGTDGTDEAPPPDCEVDEPQSDPVIVGPWLGAAPEETLDERSPEADEAPQLGVMAEFVLGTLSRLAASEAEPEKEADEPAPPATKDSESQVSRLRDALSRADPQRLRERAPRLAPLVARLVALREASSGQAG